MPQPSTAILVISCDKYFDITKPFFELFFRYWKDCPFPVYFCSDTLSFPDSRVKNISPGRQLEWSAMLLHAINQMQEKYVLLLLEDYLFYDHVKTQEIISCLDILEKEKAGALRLACFPSSYNPIWAYEPHTEHAAAGIINRNALYRVCTQPSLFNIDFLKSILVPGENIWQFEVNASERSRTISNSCLCLIENKSEKKVHGPVTYFCTAVTKGKWMRGAVELCRRENVAVDLSVRQMETGWEEAKRKFYVSLPQSLRKYWGFLSNRFSYK